MWFNNLKEKYKEKYYEGIFYRNVCCCDGFGDDHVGVGAICSFTVPTVSVKLGLFCNIIFSS